MLRQFGFDQDVPLVFKDVVLSLPSLDPFLRLQAFSYWSRRSPQFAVPNSQRGVFASSGYTSYWRRVQKSFVDYVGSGIVREAPNLSIVSAPTSNRRLSLPTAGIVSAAASSKTRFAEWHASRGGWVVYGQDFPETWLGDSFIIGASSGVPIKRGATETISAATAPSKGKDVKSKRMKAADVGESTGGVEIGSEAKRRKSGKSQAHLAPQEGKDVREPLVSRTRKKTKVEPSFPQVPVTASVHGSLGSSGLVSQPPLGPSGRTRSKQKTSRESVERERRARLLSFFSFFFFVLHLFLFC